MELFHLEVNFHTSVRLSFPMTTIQLSSTRLWQHPTGETLTTETWERFGMRHMQPDRARTQTHS